MLNEVRSRVARFAGTGSTLWLVAPIAAIALGCGVLKSDRGSSPQARADGEGGAAGAAGPVTDGSDSQASAGETGLTTSGTAGSATDGSPVSPVQADAGTEQILYERGQVGMRAIEVDESRVYWNEADSTGTWIYGAPKDGSGPVTRLGTASGLDVTQNLIAIDSTDVFWIEDSHVNRASKTGGEVTRIDMGEGHGFGGVRVDDTHIYVVERYCAALGRVPKAGGTAEYTTMPGPYDLGGVTGIAIDDTSLFCARGPYIYVQHKGGGVVATLVSDLRSVGPIESDGVTVYFGNNDRAVGSVISHLGLVPKTGGPWTYLMAYGSPIGELLLDRPRQALYHQSLLDATRAISEFTLTTSATRNLIEHVRADYGIAHDEDYVYWVGDASIRRIRK